MNANLGFVRQIQREKEAVLDNGFAPTKRFFFSKLTPHKLKFKKYIYEVYKHK